MIASAEFRDKWTLRKMPACDEGMALLEGFARIHTEKWKIVLVEKLVELRPEVIGIYNDRWIAFADHCSDCGKCNEC